MHQKQEMLFRNHKMEQIYKANTLFKDKKIVSSALKKIKMEDLRYPIGNFELQVQLYYFNKLNLAMVYPTFLPNMCMESLKI